MPEGDWYCSRCKPNQQPQPQKKKRQTFVYTEDDDDEDDDDMKEEEESEDSDESTLESLFDDSPYVFPLFLFTTQYLIIQ